MVQKRAEENEEKADGDEDEDMKNVDSRDAGWI